MQDLVWGELELLQVCVHHNFYSPHPLSYTIWGIVGRSTWCKGTPFWLMADYFEPPWKDCSPWHVFQSKTDQSISWFLNQVQMGVVVVEYMSGGLGVEEYKEGGLECMMD